MLTLCHNYFRIYPNNKTEKDASQHFSKKKFVFGIFLLLLVDIVWVVSSELTKYIYVEKKLERPFLVTYVRSSLLLVYLMVLCFIPPTKDPCKPADYTQLLEQSAETDDENYFNESTNSLGDSTFVPVRAGETTDSDDATPRAVRFNKVAEVRVMSAAQAGEALLARLSWAASVRASEHAQRRAAAAATRRHLRLALTFAVPWFISNYLYRLSLLHTSASSATIYTSSAAAFAVTLGSIFAYGANDRFTLSKSIAVLLIASSITVLGVSEGQHSSWTGALAALGSALSYATHLLLFRRELSGGCGVNSALLVGLVGCACACVTWVGGGALAGAGLERATLPPPRGLAWLLLDAALGPLLLDSLWLWGRSLTSSRTATGMVALTMPLSVCAEGWRGGGGGVGGGDGWCAAAALLAAGGWLLAAVPPAPPTDAHAHARGREPLAWLRGRVRAAADGFTAIRNMPELDEQSEALMSSDEPT